MRITGYFSNKLTGQVRRLKQISAVVLLSLLLPHGANACETPAGTDISAIITGLQTQNSCYGGAQDSSELTLWVRQQLTAAEIPPNGELQESHLQAVEQIVQRLSAAVTSEAITLENNNLTGASGLRAVANKLNQESPSQTTIDLRAQRATDGGWSVALDDDLYGPFVGDAPLLRPVSDLLAPNCQTPASDACATATNSLSELIRVANLMQTVNQRADRTLGINLLALQRNNVMWDLYTNDARVQYPWEMLLNGHLYQRELEQRSPGGAQDVALTDRIPPDSQIILLHPGIGFEYVDEATDGSRFEPAVIMEWIGFNRWRYEGSGTDVRMARPMGISLVTTLSDRNGSKNVGHGVALHWNHKLTTGVSWRSGGEVGIFVSVGLADRFK